jgi:hypothetical protein
MGADLVWGAAALPPDDVPVEALRDSLTRWLSDPANADRVAEVGDLIGFTGTPRGVLWGLLDAVEEFRRGDHDREVGFLDTYDEYGRPVTLTLSAEMSWGDVHGPALVLMALSALPMRWWER